MNRMGERKRIAKNCEDTEKRRVMYFLYRATNTKNKNNIKNGNADQKEETRRERNGEAKRVNARKNDCATRIHSRHGT